MALHCPATLFLAGTGDEGWAGDLARLLAEEHIARVWSGEHPGVAAVGREAAALLGVDAAVLAELDVCTAEGSPVIAHRDALGYIADLHRGENVLVVLADAPGEAAPTRVVVGDDGWVVRPPGD